MLVEMETENVYTDEYQKTKIIGTTKIEYIHPIEFAQRWKENLEKFDFAITFSSIEHSGQGRYGDPVDPIGDLREVMKVMCLLRKGEMKKTGQNVIEDTKTFPVQYKDYVE
ncbi:hypothetical protein ANCDUO_13388 [Ancylostoma duodenale]|uniref:Uncharacterized protein n=1 Tax=Ancylostoma duodenale TaxID=51022 RepID=A0A0C2GH87_9BILA|nr:hypothetical protein ANCDUO_13388 [Ancylostoma duodenale]